MKRHAHLFEQVVTWANLHEAAHKAARGKSNRPDVARFFFHLEPELFRLQEELAKQVWRPDPYRSFRIADPKPRQISAASFHDRVVHHAIMNVLDPFFEARLPPCSFACRKNKGTHAAVRAAQRQARRHPYFLKGDVDHYFETLRHDVLQALLRRIFKDARLLQLLDLILDSPGAFDSAIGIDPDGSPGRGLPIGNLTSQYFANHVLGELDRFVTRELRVSAYLRFMDDFLLFGPNKADLHQHRAAIRVFLADRLRLRLKEKVSFIAPTHLGIPFLGFRVFPALIRLQGERWRRMRRKIRRREQAFREGRVTIEELAGSVRSSVAHIEHASTRRLRRDFFVLSSDLG